MILLVEDDEDVRDMLALTLHVNGFDVELAENGTSALQVLERRRPCLMILDLVMPRLGGRAVLGQMKTRGSDVPVCIISALDGPPPEGVVAALRKPFETAALVEIAARYCTRRAGAAAS